MSKDKGRIPWVKAFQPGKEMSEEGYNRNLGNRDSEQGFAAD